MSFRAGSNVEFGTGLGTPGAGPGAADVYALDEPARKGRDFSNPMYEAVTRAAAAGDPEPPLREYNSRNLSHRNTVDINKLTHKFLIPQPVSTRCRRRSRTRWCRR